jgi:thioredoxin 2
MSNSREIRCQNCGTLNRVAAQGIERGLQPVCGKCRSPLAANSAPVIVTDATFAAEIERSPLPVLLDMWAPWCGPCKTIAPMLEQLASEMAGRIRVAKLNVDDNPATASRFGVQSIPTLLVFKGGAEVDRLVGAHPKQTIVQRMERALGL